MSYSDEFIQQSKLMLHVLQLIRKQPDFALKGGTAINYFYTDMPRVSVDIDLVFVPLMSREETIIRLNAGLVGIAKSLEKANIKITMDKPAKIDVIPKIRVSKGLIDVKIETNGIFRGTVLPTEERSLSQIATKHYDLENFTVHCSSLADTYAGKFCAALIRQHPRDLFDVKHFFEKYTISDELRQAFVVYLCSDRRPFHEILSPNIKHDQSRVFENEFFGMTNEKINYEELAPITHNLATTMRKNLTSNEKQFILSMAAGEPDWDAMPYSHLIKMPSLQWKLMNIRNMEKNKKRLMIEKTEDILCEF